MILGGAVLGGTPLSAGNAHAATSGPATYTLTCDAGAYVLAGQSAILQRAYSLSCDAGAYTLTSIAASLVRGYTLACAPGAYALAGGNAILKREYALTCAPGSYALAGGNATLAYVPGAVAYALACDAGSYSLAGGDATLTYVAGTPAVGRRYKHYAKAYLKRGHEVLVFAGEDEKERFLEAEKQASRPIKKKAKLPAVVKPSETIELPELARQVEQFKLPEFIAELIARSEFERIMQIHTLVRDLRDEEDIEALLLA